MSTRADKSGAAPTWSEQKRLQAELRRAAGHNVPRAGTLNRISYCCDCGAAFDSVIPCPGTSTP